MDIAILVYLSLSFYNFLYYEYLFSNSIATFRRECIISYNTIQGYSEVQFPFLDTGKGWKHAYL